MWWQRRERGKTHVVGEGQALIVGNTANLLEDEGVGALDGSGGDDDDLGAGESAEEGETRGELHLDCCGVRRDLGEMGGCCGGG